MKREDIEFLKGLQHELKTQDTECNAQPVHWGIMEKREIISPGGSIAKFYVDGEPYYRQDFIELLDCLITDLEVSDFTNIKEEWHKADKNKISVSELEWFAMELELDYDLDYMDEEDVLSELAGCFLTKKAAQSYLDKHKRHHRNGRVYSMHATANPELKRFLELFMSMDLDRLAEGEPYEPCHTTVFGFDIDLIDKPPIKVKTYHFKDDRWLDCTYNGFIPYLEDYVKHAKAQTQEKWKAIDKNDDDALLKFAKDEFGMEIEILLPDENVAENEQIADESLLTNQHQMQFELPMDIPVREVKKIKAPMEMVEMVRLINDNVHALNDKGIVDEWNGTDKTRPSLVIDFAERHEFMEADIYHWFKKWLDLANSRKNNQY